MALSDTTAGYLAVLGAILFFGSFGKLVSCASSLQSKSDLGHCVLLPLNFVRVLCCCALVANYSSLLS